MRSIALRLVLFASAAFVATQLLLPPHTSGPDATVAGEGVQLVTHDLPPEAVETLRLIRGGGPFPFRQDGTTFQNRERLLPDRPVGYYREYTVRTPGATDRGARRFVTGGEPPEIFYYTADHYRSFRRIKPSQ